MTKVVKHYSKPAEKFFYWCTKKKANMFKAKRLIEKGDTSYLNQCSHHLSIQFLITASTFPFSSKNSSAEHIHILPICLTLINTLTQIDKHTHLNTHTHTYTLTHTLIPQPNIFSFYQHGSPSQQTHSYRQTTHTHTHTYTHTHTHTDTLTLTHPGICIRKREYVRLSNF